MTAPEDVFVGPAIEVSAQPASSVTTFTFRALVDVETEPVAAAVTDAAEASAAAAYASALAAAPPTPREPGGVRHAAGYGPFAAYVVAQGGDPKALALSGGAIVLLRYLRKHAAAVQREPELRRAAGIFLGNYLASMRADASWRADESGPCEVGAGRRSYVIESILAQALESASDSPAEFDERAQDLVDSLREWAWEAADDALPPPPLPTPRSAASASPRYERPSLPSTVFLDDAGEPIDYGNRWGADGPAEESYSVTANLERYASLHTVASALIDHLEQVYDVEVVHEQVTDAASLLLRPHGGVSRLVRVLPRDPQAAPLRFVFTDYPGVIVEAGVLHSFASPMCGCEACDEGVDALATELEQLVFAVANGGYAEHYPVGRRRDLHYGLVTLGALGDTVGARSGYGEPSGISAERLAHGEAALAALPHGWQPWPLRA